MCVRKYAVKIHKQTQKNLVGKKKKVFKSMLEREKALQEYFFEKCIFY